MLEIISLPKILDMPEKMLEVIKQFNDFRYFLIEGGRGGGKSQGVARFLIYLAEQRSLRICCGRETQNSIDESVYTILRDIIQENRLAFNVLASRIEHNTSGSAFRFKGFREQGAVNIKGLEGVDVLWIDEAQSITKHTLDVIIPTIRKENAKVIFSMNRYMRNDPVYEEFKHREDCLHIRINYMENQFCSHALKHEAEECKQKDTQDYEHIWLGYPLPQADNLLFSSEELENAAKAEFYYREADWGFRLYGQDVARYGVDKSVAVIIEQKGPEHWEVVYKERWAKKDLMDTTGRVVDIKSRLKPVVSIIDGDGMGAGVVDRLEEIKVEVIEFRGGLPLDKDDPERKRYADRKTKAYYTLKEMLQLGRLRITDKDILKELETVRFEYASNGTKRIVSKEKMRDKHKVRSPDHADALMMAVSEICNMAKVYEKQQDSLPKEYEHNDSPTKDFDSARLPKEAIMT